eukprot:gene23620-biopygen10366
MPNLPTRDGKTSLGIAERPKQDIFRANGYELFPHHIAPAMVWSGCGAVLQLECEMLRNPPCHRPPLVICRKIHEQDIAKSHFALASRTPGFEKALSRDTRWHHMVVHHSTEVTQSGGHLFPPGAEIENGETAKTQILYVISRPKCRMCDFLFYTAPPPPFPPTGRQEGRRRCPETVVGKLDQPPVPSTPSAHPGRAAGGGGRAARGANLRAGMRP